MRGPSARFASLRMTSILAALRVLSVFRNRNDCVPGSEQIVACVVCRPRQKVVSVNPVTHLSNASRGLMHGNVDGSSVVWVLVASAIVTAIFAPVAMQMYHRER